MIVHSSFLIIVGGWWMPSTQAASHNAGQMRPVTSGKLLVSDRRLYASSHFS